MTEELITFETSKLAKEKNYPITKGMLMSASIYDDEGYPIVSQSLLQRWLREVHNIHIEIKVEDYINFPTYYWSIFGKYKTNNLIRCLVNSGDKGMIEKFSTYEEALEIALQEGLKLIKL